MLETAIVILAGGKATRFPGKLERRIDGEPMLLRVYRNARATSWPVYVAARGSFDREIDERLDCPVLVDPRPDSGPLEAFVAACAEIQARRVIAWAGDAPLVDRTVFDALLEAWRPGDEAVVPRHGERIEPLAAVYERSTVLRQAFTVLREGNGAMHSLIDRLHARFVDLPERYFLNVNTPADLAALTGSHA